MNLPCTKKGPIKIQGFLQSWNFGHLLAAARYSLKAYADDKTKMTKVFAICLTKFLFQFSIGFDSHFTML